MRLICRLVLLATPALAEDRRVLDDAAIKLALTARVLAYPDGASQNFLDDGRTLYQVTNATSWGKWWVAGGQYCSSWPPSESVSCYDIHAQGLQVRFTGSGGDRTVGQYVDPN
jgi:hypothetical protein